MKTSAVKANDQESDRRPERERSGSWYVTDEELIEILGVPPANAKEFFEAADRDPKKGFPPKSKLFPHRRYLPAVKAYFDELNGLKMTAPVSRFPRESNDR